MTKELMWSKGHVDLLARELLLRELKTAPWAHGVGPTAAPTPATVSQHSGAGSTTAGTTTAREVIEVRNDDIEDTAGPAAGTTTKAREVIEVKDEDTESPSPGYLMQGVSTKPRLPRPSTPVTEDPYEGSPVSPNHCDHGRKRGRFTFIDGNDI